MTYSNIADHATMVFDDRRNAVYNEALRQLVRPGSVVLDLGAGLGIHGLLAAIAGAARVYMVDPEPVVLAAAEVARAQGLGDRVVAVQARIEDASLPEQVDVIVSVLTGNLLFSEDLLPSLIDARNRFLRTAGRLIPDRAQLIVAPVNAPHLHERYITRWSRPVVGIDYSIVRALAANEVIPLSREDLQGCALLCSGEPLSDIDLCTVNDADASGSVRVHPCTGGLCHGLLGWVRMRLGDQWLDTGPTSPAVHWTPMYLPLERPISLEPERPVEITIGRPAYGDWTWQVSAGSESRRQSTFLSSIDGPAQWMRSAPQSAPGLNRMGDVVARILTGIGEGRSLAEVAQLVVEANALPASEAMRTVQYLARRYGGSK